MSTPELHRKVRRIFSALHTDYMLGAILVGLIEAMIIVFALRMLTYLISVDRALPSFIGVSADIWLALLAGIIVFAWRGASWASKYSVDLVETKISDFKEALVTVKDTMRDDSIAVDALREDLVDIAAKTSSEPLLPLRQVRNRLVILGAIVFVFIYLPLFSSWFGFLPEALPAIDWPGADDSSDAADNTDSATGAPDPIDFGDSRGIYGDAQLNNSNASSTQDLTVDRGSGRGDFSNPMAWQNEQVDEHITTRKRVSAVIDTPAVEQLPDEYELARRYNLKVRSLQ